MSDLAARLASRLEVLDWVTAISLGGSRAQGTHRPDSDWDLGLYYRASKASPVPGDLQSLGYPGTVTEAGEWGPLMNGGAWLDVDGTRVDLLYRDLDAIDHYYAEAREGRFEIIDLLGYIAGMPTYTLLGELALGKLLSGALPEVTFPAALRKSGAHVWTTRAAFHLRYALGHAALENYAGLMACLARAALEVAHGRLCERGSWILNEKRLLAEAGLGEVDELLARGCRAPFELVTAISGVLNIEPMSG